MEEPRDVGAIDTAAVADVEDCVERAEHDAAARFYTIQIRTLGVCQKTKTRGDDGRR